MSSLAPSQAGGKLLLVHGYCAGQNEFPLSQFDNAVQFEDFKQVRSNDAFALKIRDFGNQFDSFSIVRSTAPVLLIEQHPAVATRFFSSAS
jgi:hypothetical protein